MIAKTFSSAHHGVDGILVEVEASLQNALPQIHLTGLPGTMIKESKDRLEACFTGLGFNVPSGRVVVHLSPANAPKQGSHYDLAIALSVLSAEGKIPGTKVGKTGAIAELSLDGRLRGIPGAIPLIEAMEKDPNVEVILVSKENSFDAALFKSKKAFVANDIGECIDFMRGERILPRPHIKDTQVEQAPSRPTLDYVIGQRVAKRALQVALAGQHHLLFLGPPGVGKSLLAHAAADLLPPLFPEEKIALHKIFGSGSRYGSFDGVRPFRSPHHSISAVGLLGGGTGAVYPGEISLAHSGVLFLDEFLEFHRNAVEGLREPLQSGVVHLHRAQMHFTFPARFSLVAAMNPCPCGYSMSAVQRCRCAMDKLIKYRKRLSGPILDRIDLSVILGTPVADDSPLGSLSHESVRESIGMVRELHRERGEGWTEIQSEYFTLDSKSEDWLKDRARQLALSFRSIHKVIRVARTIADLEKNKDIDHAHLLEAWSLRCLESLNPFSS